MRDARTFSEVASRFIGRLVILASIAVTAISLLFVADPASAETFTVTNTDDEGVGSLRMALTLAETSDLQDTIEFDIPGEGVKTITPQTLLPFLRGGDVLDGYSQEGASENTLDVGNDAKILIELDGSEIAVQDGSSTECDIRLGPSREYIRKPVLNVEGAGTEARGVVINDYEGCGVYLSSGGTLTGSYVGTNPEGTEASGGDIGIYTADGTIGAAEPGDRNVIAGNDIGVEIRDGSSRQEAAVVIQNNYIGTDASGEKNLGNVIGILSRSVYFSGPTQIGGHENGEGNLISGNDGAGITFGGSRYTGNFYEVTIEGNRIGTNATGERAIGNGSGIRIDGPTRKTLIGGTEEGAGNLISGNEGEGIFAGRGQLSTSNIYIQGNFIGTDVSGKKAVGNSVGVRFLPRNEKVVIGGTNAAARNVISGNRLDGLAFIGYDAVSDAKVQGNYIGTDITGTKRLGNRRDGIRVSTRTIFIGGTDAGARNVISGNGRNGIYSGGASSVINAYGNYIGTDSSGRNPLGNKANGIQVQGYFYGAIGGDGSGQGNVIAFNKGAGIKDTSSTGADVRGNSIFSNKELGIDVGKEGVNQIVRFNPDTPGKILTNYPALTSVKFSGGTTTVTGNLTGTPETTYVIRFFASPVADGSGYGEGKTYLGKRTVKTNEVGKATFTYKSEDIQRSQFVTATATFIASSPNGSGNPPKTSEFSKAVKAG